MSFYDNVYSNIFLFLLAIMLLLRITQQTGKKLIAWLYLFY